MTTVKNDYSLLRPFDLEAAKRGEHVMWFGDVVHWASTSYRAFMAQPWEIVEFNDQLFYVCTSDLRMAPLAWVEGKPVYRGDVLYKLGCRFEVHGIKKSFFGEDFLVLQEDGLNTEYADNRRECLTWNPPKVKREGWVNIYQHNRICLRPTKEDADLFAATTRIACVRIEWEEEAK